MKRYYFLFSIVIVFISSFLLLSSSYKYDLPLKANVIVENITDIQSIVYICTGSFAYRFHSTPYCSGLNNCRGDIIKMSLKNAKKKGRTPCRKCY